MPRYLIDVPHEDEYAACVKALHALQAFGSHWVTHADFGCNDNVHRGWLIVELDCREQARDMVPPEFRRDAKIIELRRFTPEELEEMRAELEP